LVDTGYRTLSFPFREFRAPKIELMSTWDFENMLGFLSSWSAVANYKKRKGSDPIAVILDRLKAEKKNVKWPLSIRVGRIR